MNITDEMIEAALSTNGPVNNDLSLYEALHRLLDESKRIIVRNALTAALGVQKAPLEDVLPVGIQIGLFPVHDEQGALTEIEWESRSVSRHTGTSGSATTVDAAIRDAVRSATGKGDL